MFSISYEVVTPESAEQGDADESGMLAEGLTLREAYANLSGDGTPEPDSSHGAPRWLTFPSDTDYATGAETSKTLHFPRKISPASAMRVARLFRVKVRHLTEFERNYLNGVEDCQWLRDTALNGYDVPAFAAFTFSGHEDCPLSLTLYADVEPNHDAKPVARYVLVTDAVSNLSRYRRT